MLKNLIPPGQIYAKVFDTPPRKEGRLPLGRPLNPTLWVGYRGHAARFWGTQINPKHIDKRL